jgi:hypothetical protein
VNLRRIAAQVPGARLEVFPGGKPKSSLGGE